MALTQQIRRSRYYTLGFVGHGQFGRVYCAIHRRTGELVAIKDLNKDRFPTHKFLRELRFLISLEHPSIVTCHALEHSTSGRQLVLDYCEGGTLRSLLESDTPLTVQEVLGFILDILAALDCAHRQGIVHCDIKPENILMELTPGGWVARVSDLGIARLSQEAKQADMGHTGSPAYMAPERFYNQHPPAADLYAVGVILYELLLGQRPFSGTPMELMVAHLNRSPVMPNQLPEPFNQVIRKALQKLLPKRYDSAQAMRTDLMAVYQTYQAQGHLAEPVYPKVLPDIDLASDLSFVCLPHPTTALGLVPMPQGHLLVTCNQQQVWFYHWPEEGMVAAPINSQGFTLPYAVHNFLSIPQGGLLVTEQSLHLLSMTHGLGCIAQGVNPNGTAIAPNGRWFATVNEQTSQALDLSIYQLTTPRDEGVKISAPLTVTMPTEPGDQLITLLAVDNGHSVVVVRRGNRTLFHGVTRRGNYLGTISASVPLYSLTPAQRPYRYLALEENCPNAVLIVDLRPFRMLRHRVDITPCWLFETAVGYGLLSPTGEFSLINYDGQIINRIANLPHPQAMVQQSPTRYLWSVNQGTNSRIYTVELTNLATDIVV
ncbi:serine/threonine protein kinase [Nodosilinea sp. LEGE 07088]|uniref:serine/threonine-protein kinase n=1 Tax=Nodosilinea sp. LEGE 07088 TaxID=2777968 RepID=UPI0018825238|nr:serine/threonine-protein kinase [Nodosilinea sp. LEGE 07088]MBE9136076.1 serine/threonine protein kinase [Nodosilinea sp. LEGE 07088]